ncbi:Fe-S cluster assembly ATPase SufC [Candidatus Peribacteria bacterium RIFCSPLOWO2_12_FULL_55_15]|nr:MAG: Fe-S cluster assembly ATPase SufC [Candidatus Peribacteria bacterium RIFCSPHIGHO2_01_FULL_54_22]OGJ62909.1 MAG: Fe-S cluster assembly ATPase SufC [Candidatus Peribacteria bacterium RIFCSPHIGHO2_02_FULL_55_24]OGJ65105.1 MAG: Fe-S cluster assembly ATPase SufC [Candidatus Peribacteria bacterium RIFCSPHIGHO2_12_FULL_54_10]OGJ67295.1 MAG: Fe-S cluster assembly ATPase SufC [Candidatus Peribacteria bacterium RIFCSPLOWO2_01_FULL_54_110]OGJ70027.1 MAG: Fe-S cluster assembly ATPase SufC [Candidat
MVEPLLLIKNLHVAIEGKEIVHGIDLVIGAGELHVVMGPNGSGKSTLVHTLMGHPRSAVTGGSVLFRGQDLLAMSPDARARGGLFLAFQYPRELAGVPLRSFLYAAYKQHTTARNMRPRSLLSFQSLLAEEAERLHFPSALLDRPVHVGLSGGERKKCEILQLRVLRPALALLDETDSGLDIDALRVVAEGVQQLRDASFSVLLVTHYARMLQYLRPDHVHVMIGGKIVESGGPDLAQQLEKEGYEKWTRVT